MSELDNVKHDIVTGLFVDMADQDYFMCRVCYYAGYINGFFWSAEQAIEKYLKASLLLNGKSSRGYGHDLVSLFEEVNKYASDLFPEYLSKPEGLIHVHGWPKEHPKEFLDRISPYTESHSRYNIWGYNLDLRDLYHLDQFIFHARRVASRLDKSIYTGSKETIRDRLERDQKYEWRKHVFNKFKELESSKSLYDMAIHANLPFAPDDYEHGQVPIRSWSSSSPLHWLGYHPLSGELSNWVMSKIGLPERLKEAIQNNTPEIEEIEGKARQIAEERGLDRYIVWFGEKYSDDGFTYTIKGKDQDSRIFFLSEKSIFRIKKKEFRPYVEPIEPRGENIYMTTSPTHPATRST